MDPGGLPWPPAAHATTTSHARVHAIGEASNVRYPPRMIDQRVKAWVRPERGDPITEPLLEVFELRTVWILHHALRFTWSDAKFNAGHRIVCFDLGVELRQLFRGDGTLDDKIYATSRSYM